MPIFNFSVSFFDPLIVWNRWLLVLVLGAHCSPWYNLDACVLAAVAHTRRFSVTGSPEE
jgi:hypothetical protein